MNSEHTDIGTMLIVLGFAGMLGVVVSFFCQAVSQAKIERISDSQWFNWSIVIGCAIAIFYLEKIP